MKMKGKRVGITKTDILKFVEGSPKLQEWVARVRNQRGWHTSYASTLAAVMFLASRTHPDKALEFINSFVTGENLPPNSPILALRNRLGTEKKLTKLTRFNLVVHSWNIFIEGKEIRILRIPKDEVLPIKGA